MCNCQLTSMRMWFSNFHFFSQWWSTVKISREKTTKFKGMRRRRRRRVPPQVTTQYLDTREPLTRNFSQNHHFWHYPFIHQGTGFKQLPNICSYLFRAPTFTSTSFSNTFSQRFATFLAEFRQLSFPAHIIITLPSSSPQEGVKRKIITRHYEAISHAKGMYYRYLKGPAFPYFPLSFFFFASHF